MADTKWTPAQSDAIYDNGGTLLVSAAAGSGKTAVLVERAVRLLTDEEHPVAADRILIVTFTRAAAEELRARIGVRLAAAAAAQPNSLHLRRQRLLLGRAAICTIDAYCMQLLQRYFAELELPPDFGVADDATAFSLRQASLARVLETLYDDVDFADFASLYGRARSDAPAANAVLALYDFTRSLPHPDAVLEQLCAVYEADASLPDTLWGKALLQSALESTDNALTLLQAAREIVANEPAIQNYDAALSGDAAFFTALQDLLRQRRWDDAALYTQQFSPARLKPPVRGYQGTEGDEVKRLREMAKAALKQLHERVFVCTCADFENDRARLAPMLRALARAVVLFAQEFYNAKLAEKVLEYSDFEHLALKLLCDEHGEKTPLAETVSRGFDAVMVDEYQDTNALQALLYACLANEDGSNLFFVGDVKQSIYRFRLASPGIFIEKRESFTPYAMGCAHPATITLGHNFRSAGSVIAQINDVFCCLMSRAVGDVAYTADEQLVQGAQDTYDGGPMELKLVDTGGAESENGDAGAVADTIVQMVQSGFAVREKGGGIRPCRYDDFCILLRTRGKFAQYAAALAQRSVPAFADTGESWLTSPEVSPLLSLLRVIDNPGQDVHLAAVLLSPLFHFTPDDLAEVRTAAPKGRLYAALLQSELEKARQVCEMLRVLRTLAVTLPLDALCAEVFARTHYFSAVGAMENGAARRENLRSFTAFAASASAATVGGLSGFLRRVDNAIESGATGSSAPAAVPQGSVAIMTIHRSKGLEFPVCILADAAHGFNLRDASNAVLFHPLLGAGFRLRAENGGNLFSTAPHAAIQLAIQRESVSEEMRVLYVALTRARDKLIVTAPLKDPAKTLTELAIGLAGTGCADAYTLGRQNSFAAWLCTAALLHPDCDALRKAAGGIPLPLFAARGRMHAEIIAAGDAAVPGESPRFIHTAQPDAALAQRLTENFAYSKVHANAPQLPAKLSVSAISHGMADPILSRPAFLYQEGLTAAERGTAQHAFLQFADFAAAAQNLNAEIDRLVQSGYLAAALAEKLPRARIQAFLSAPICHRMQQAETLLREYDFITAVPAKFVTEPEQLPPHAAYTPVLVQGIADVVCVNGATAEIIDYKTDRGKTPEQFVQRYAKQLQLYRRAIEKRLDVTVPACTIYAFENGLEIPVPLDAEP